MQINFIFSPIICHFVSSISVFLGNMSLTFNHGISSVSRNLSFPYVSRVCQVSKRINMRFLHFSSRFFCVYEINLVTLQRFSQNI